MMGKPTSEYNDGDWTYEELRSHRQELIDEKNLVWGALGFDRTTTAQIVADRATTLRGPFGWVKVLWRRATATTEGARRQAAVGESRAPELQKRGRPPGFCILCGYDAGQPIHADVTGPPMRRMGRDFRHPYTETL